MNSFCIKKIPEFPNYSITTQGKVYSNRFNRWLKPSFNLKTGYLQVILYTNKQRFCKRIHRLVLETFIGPCPNGMESCHNDDNKLNNLLSNLRWDTKSNNTKDAIKYGKHVDNRGELCGQSKLTAQDVRMIIYMYRTGLFTQLELAKIYNVGHTIIHNIVNKKKWKHLWSNIL